MDCKILKGLILFYFFKLQVGTFMSLVIYDVDDKCKI